MMYSYLIKIIGVVVVVFSAFSCSSDLDFNQVNDFNIQPAFTTNLAYFNPKASDFIIIGSEQSSFSFLSNVDIFNSSFVENDLVRTDLYFKINNTINRSYIYNITFLNASNVALNSIDISIPAYNGTVVIVEKTFVFEGLNIDIIKNTESILFSVKMLAGPPLTVDSAGQLESSSSITAYFDVK
jgi:hypothetical protein